MWLLVLVEMGIEMNIDIDHRYLSALSRIFAPVVLDPLARSGTSKYLSEVLIDSGLSRQFSLSLPLRSFLDWVYSFLTKNYRSEYIYKNMIANKVLLGRHSLNTAHMLIEFRVANCKADVIILNGSSNVYEIKSEYDSFGRLKEQIDAYLSAFDHINVITSGSKVNELKSLLPAKVGILVLTNRNTIQTIKKSESNRERIIQSVLFDSLRKTEYLAVISKHFGQIPDVPNTRIYGECKQLFSEIPAKTAHDLAVAVLRRRKASKTLRDFLNVAPSCLTAYALSNYSDSQKLRGLTGLFETSIGALLSPSIT